MKRKLGILFCFVSAPIGAVAVWPALIEKGPPYGFILPVMPFVMLAIGIMELQSYCRVATGKPNKRDIERELRQSTARKFHFRDLYPNAIAAYYFFAAAWSRAKRNWPAKEVEIRRNLARSWSRQEWIGISIFLGGEALFLFGFWWFDSPAWAKPSETTVLIGTTMLLINLLGIMFWAAGDDDDSGHRPRRPKPRPVIAHFRLRTSVINRYRTLSK